MFKKVCQRFPDVYYFCLEFEVQIDVHSNGANTACIAHNTLRGGREFI